MNLKNICELTCELARNAGEFIRSERSKLVSSSIETKGKNDFVTEVDKASEVFLVKGLSQILPGSGFITEEGTATKKDESFVWIIDPIDGTTNFIHGAPPYSISIALQQDEKTVLGIIYEITADECFYAYSGGKAWLNGEEISVSPVENLENSLIATGFPYKDLGRMNAFNETLEYFFHNSQGVRRLGSAAVDLAYVACGRYDGFYEYNLNAWDVAAGAFIVEMAGGKVADFKGDGNFLFGKEIIAANSDIFEEFKEAVGGIMNA